MRYLIFLLLFGCASQLTDDEREYNDQIDRENWYECQKIYTRSGVTIYSNHMHTKHKKHRDSDVRDDLRLNNCKFLMRDTYADKL